MGEFSRWTTSVSSFGASLIQPQPSSLPLSLTKTFLCPYHQQDAFPWLILFCLRRDTVLAFCVICFLVHMRWPTIAFTALVQLFYELHLLLPGLKYYHSPEAKRRVSTTSTVSRVFYTLLHVLLMSSSTTFMTYGLFSYRNNTLHHITNPADPNIAKESSMSLDSKLLSVTESSTWWLYTHVILGHAPLTLSRCACRFQNSHRHPYLHRADLLCWLPDGNRGRDVSCSSPFSRTQMTPQSACVTTSMTIQTSTVIPITGPHTTNTAVCSCHSSYDLHLLLS